MATSAKRRAQYQAMGLLSMPVASPIIADPNAVAPTGAAVTFAGGRGHAISGKTAGLEASAAANQTYVVYGVAFVALVAATYLIIRAVKG